MQKTIINKSVFFLCFAQFCMISIAVLSVEVCARAGLLLSSSVFWSTMPYGLQFLGLLLMALPVARMSRLIGRKKTLFASTVMGLMGAGTAVVALGLKRYDLFCLAHFLIGCGLGGGNFFRYCVVEVCTPERKKEALSLIMSAGIASALFAPFLSRQNLAFWGLSFLPCLYVCMALLFGAALLCLCLSVFPCAGKYRKTGITIQTGTMQDIRRDNLPSGWKMAIAAGALGYLFMNLLMIEYPLMLTGRGMGFGTMSCMIELHVLGMFVPSLFTAFLIEKIGARGLIFIGGLLLLVVALYPFWPPSVAAGFVCLVLLGMSWNFTYIGGSSIISHASADVRAWLQGCNEFCVSFCAMAGAFLPGFVVGSGHMAEMAILAFLVGAGLSVMAWRSGRSAICRLPV